jgi:cold shock CspA family protein
MENGFIKFYNREAGFGYIQSMERDIFFHVSEAKNELKQLLNTNKWREEPILFNKRDSQRKEGKYEAFDINIDHSKRKIGYVEIEEGKYSALYFICEFNTSTKYFFHYSCVKTNSADKFISIDEGDPAIFSSTFNERGLCATEVVLLDQRSYIESFAVFTDCNLALQDLAENLCEKEDWDYINDKQNSIPVLRSYINQTCKQLIRQDKIVTGISSHGDEYAFFNTGLVNRFQDEIYAYFQKNKKYSDMQPWGIKTPQWLFLEFNTDQSKYYKYFDRPAEIASYFDEADASKLVFDTTVTIRPNWEHLEKRKKRIDSPNILAMNDQEFRDTIEDSINMAKKRIRRNYKTAIPHFYNNEIQFLIPMCERKNRGLAIAAMVIEKQEQIYVVSTILTLDQAYNNARLLAKPDREWLNP